MTGIPARNLRLLLAGLVVVVLLAAAYGRSFSAHEPASDAGIHTTADAVALGILDQQVVDEARAGGADAYVSLNVEPLIAAAIARHPDATQQAALVDDLEALIEALKDRLAAAGLGQVLDRLDGLARVEVHLGSEADVLAVVRLSFVAAVRTNRTLRTTLKESTVLVHQPEVRAEGYDGSGTYVAVLDTGVRWKEFPSFFPTGSVPEALEYVAKGADLKANVHVHGTHVASTVLAMAPGTKIIAVEVFHPVAGEAEPDGSDVSINDGVAYVLGLKKAWLRDHGQCCNVVAINLSLGIPEDYHSISCPDDYSFDLAYAYGVVPVVSAGNDAYVKFAYHYGIGAPACDHHALSVGSSTDGVFAGNAGCDPSEAIDQFSYFSQTSKTLGLIAPGQCITAAGGDLQGTSMAAPHVAGAVAVLASAKEGATPLDIWNVLVASGPTIVDDRWDPPISKHRLDLQAAVQALLAGISGGEGPAPPEGATDTLDVEEATLDRADPLVGGERADLGVVRLRNTGVVTGTYRLRPTTAGTQKVLAAPASWFETEPADLTLSPGEVGQVLVRVTVPYGTTAGTYTGLLVPERTDPASKAVTAGLRATFTVGEGNPLRGIGAMAARAAGSPWLWVGIVIVVLLLAQWRRRRRAP